VRPLLSQLNGSVHVRFAQVDSLLAVLAEEAKGLSVQLPSSCPCFSEPYK